MEDSTATRQNEATEKFVKQEIAHHGSMKAEREPYETLWRTVCGIFAPDLVPQEKAGDMRFGADIFDGGGMLALETWSKGIPGNMIYKNARWLTMRFNVRKLMDDPSVKEYCEDKSEQIFWSARRTNFYRVNPDMARYAGTIGAYLFPVIDEKKGRVFYYLEDPWYVWIARDAIGSLSQVNREITKSVKAWVDQFGKENVHPEWRREAEGINPYQTRDVLHVTTANPDYDPAKLDQREYLSLYIDVTHQWLIEKKTVDYMPMEWCVRRPPRWVYPATPAMWALTDALTNDVLTETLIQCARLSGDPQMKISESLRGAYDEGPGGITWMTDPEQLVEQVYKRMDWPVGDAERDRRLAMAERWFSVDYFRILSDMEGTPPTAYHIRRVESEKATLLGPEVGIYCDDILDPGVDVLAKEEGALSGDDLPLPPVVTDFLREMIERKFERLQLEPTEERVESYLQGRPLASLEAVYNGVLTQIETQIVQTRGYLDGVGLMEMVTGIWPEVAFAAKPYPLARHILESMNWSQDDIASKQEFEDIVRQVQESDQMQQGVEQGKAKALAYQAMTKAPEKGSAAEADMKGAT